MRTLSSLNGHGERTLFLRICVMAPFVPALMRLPLGWVSRASAALVRPRHRRSAVTPERVAQLVELAQARAHPLVRRGCLTRGVSLLWILRRQGVDVQLAFGIGGPADDHQGHCWLILDGAPYLERQLFEDRFVELYRMPGVAR